MILSSYSILLVCAYLEIDDLVNVALTSSRLYRLLTNPSYFSILSQENENLPPLRDFHRGLKKMLDSHFYRINNAQISIMRITSINDICYRYRSYDDSGDYIVDIFGCLFRDDGDDEFNPMFIGNDNIFAKEVLPFPESYYDQAAILDYDGNIIFQEMLQTRKFSVHAQKLLVLDRSSITFVDDKDQFCHITRTGIVTFLCQLPSCLNIEVYHSSDNEYYLIYALTEAGDLYWPRGTESKTMLNEIDWNKPFRHDVKKVLPSIIDLYYVNKYHQLMIYDTSLGNEQCLIENVLDVVQCSSYMYVLKKGIIYRGQLWEKELTVVEYVPEIMSRIDVTYIDWDHSLIRVW